MGSKDDGYARVTSEHIVSAIRQYGPSARIPRRASLGLLHVADVAGIQPGAPYLYKASSAVDLAVDRIEELEERLTAERAWMESLMNAVSEHRPHETQAEYDMAWQVLCKHARGQYDRLAQVVYEEYRRREHERLERWA